MAATTRQNLKLKLPGRQLLAAGAWRLAFAALIAAVVFFAGRSGGWWLAILTVAAAEMWGLWPQPKRREIIDRLPLILMGAAIAIIIAIIPKAASQLVLAGLYGAWRFAAGTPTHTNLSPALVLAAIAAVLEAVFLMAAVWQLPAAATLVLVWLGSFAVAYQALLARGEKAATLLASVWALIATECAWVFLRWLVSYVARGGYVIVPQAALVLTAMAYCFGGIYLVHREGKLNRARLTEFMLIGLVILAVVIAGTGWQGNL